MGDMHSFEKHLTFNLLDVISVHVDTLELISYICHNNDPLDLSCFFSQVMKINNSKLPRSVSFLGGLLF